MEISKSMPPPSPNPITQLQTRFKELETGFKAWLARQSSPVDAITAGAVIEYAAEGAVVGSIVGLYAPFLITSSLRKPMWGPFMRAHGPKFGHLCGINDIIFGFFRRTEGVDALQTSTAAAFGSGAMFSYVMGFGGPNKVASAVRSGLVVALFQAGYFQFRERILKVSPAEVCSRAEAEDMHYGRTISLLTSLGLQNYVKNFKRGLLTDSTLPLLTDRALREVKIPAGARLLILDRIQRDQWRNQLQGCGALSPHPLSKTSGTPAHPS